VLKTQLLVQVHGTPILGKDPQVDAVQVQLLETVAEQRSCDVTTQTLIPQVRHTDEKTHFCIALPRFDLAETGAADVPLFMLDREGTGARVLEHRLVPLLFLGQGEGEVRSKVLHNGPVIQPLDVVG
jgi:hypothetical protein